MTEGVPATAAVGLAPRPPQRSAIVVNPSKVVDLDGRRAEICGMLTDAGWPEPQWLLTTPEDPGCGMAAEAVSSGAEVVFACGGDGTVMAVAAVLAGTDVALAVVPSGTGNLLATNIGITRDVAAAVAVATAGDRLRIDVGVVEGVDTSSGHAGCFTVMAGMGFDARMIDGTSEPLKKRFGWPAYAVSALKNLRHRRMRVRIRLDDAAPLRRRASTVLVANVGRLQGGMRLLPDAVPDDGWLDVAVLTPHTLGHWISLAWGVMTRRGRVPRMETFRARKVEVLSNRTEPRELDGDVVAPARAMNVSIRPGALLLCVPPPD